MYEFQMEKKIVNPQFPMFVPRIFRDFSIHHPRIDSTSLSKIYWPCFCDDNWHRLYRSVIYWWFTLEPNKYKSSARGTYFECDGVKCTCLEITKRP